MAFDRIGFVKWLVSRKLKAAPTNYPSSLEALEKLGQLSINAYVPSRTEELLALLAYPASGKFKDRSKSGLEDWRASVASYDAYIRQRDKSPA